MVHPLNYGPYESFTEAMYYNKRHLVEEWGPNVPKEILDELNYWAERLRYKIDRAMSVHQRTRLGRMPLEEYLKTPEWKVIARQAYESGQRIRKLRKPLDTFKENHVAGAPVKDCQCGECCLARRLA